MRVRTIKYMAKEGVININKNLLMSIASISVVYMTLLLLGAFLIFSALLNYNANYKLSHNLQMRVYCYGELDELQIQVIEKKISSNVNVKKVEKKTRLDAMEEMKERFDGDTDILNGFDESIFPVSFVITIIEGVESNQIYNEISQIIGVEEVVYPQKEIDFLMSMKLVIKTISFFVVVILLISSITIIFNTIKLTMHARRKEISIMKYIGATNWFIRWPFIIEGIIIGMFGSGLSYFTVRYLYVSIYEKYASSPYINLLHVNEMSGDIIVLYLISSVLVGALASGISIKKYLSV